MAKTAQKQAKATMKRIKPHDNCPGWLNRNSDGTGYEEIGPRVEVVQRMFKLAAEGKGTKWIADILNEEKVPRWTARDGRKNSGSWDHKAVENIIYSIAPIGGMERANGGVDFVYPAIVSEREWTRARDRIGRKSGGPKTGKNLLQGMLFCERCQAPLKFRNMTSNDPYVECTGEEKCLKRLPYFPIQAVILDRLFKSWLNIPDFYRRSLEDEQKPLRLLMSDWVGQRVAGVYVSETDATIKFHKGKAEKLATASAAKK